MHPQLPLDLDSGLSLTFATFWPGDNTLLLDVLRRFASAGSQDAQIFINGGPGFGKTHLLSATCQLASARGYKIAYLPASLIDNEVALAGYDKFDLVCIDDMHTLAQGKASELAVFGLVNGLRERGGRLLLSADCIIADLDVQLPDLATRLAWGAAYALMPVPEEQLGPALAMRAKLLGVPLPTEVIEFLLVRYSRNFTSMLDQLDELKQASLRAKRKITIPFVREVLA